MLRALLVVSIFGCAACADSGENLGGSGAGGSANEVCSEASQLEPHPDFSGCLQPPNASCDLASFCEREQCGGKGATFDAAGCRRVVCVDDQDCAAGQRCFDTEGLTGAACVTPEYSCCLHSDGCSCVASQTCNFEKHCVDEAEL